MIHAYNKLYLDCARLSLACMLDYAVNDSGISLNDYWEMFLKSDLSTRFESGDPFLLAGRSGIEIAIEVLGERKEPVFKLEKTREYWLGWSLAYYQWYRNVRFKDINIPIDMMLNLYNPYHEMDIMQFCDKIDELLGIDRSVSNIKRIRKNAGLTQHDLAKLTNIPLRSIQQYEQKQKNINNARAEYVIMLSKVLHCRPEELLE